MAAFLELFLPSLRWAVFLFTIRSFLTAAILKHIGRYYRLAERPNTAHDQRMAQSYRKASLKSLLHRLKFVFSVPGVGEKAKESNCDVVRLVAKEVAMETRSVERWIRQWNKEVDAEKFHTAAWRVCFYIVMTSVAGTQLYKEKFAWDLSLCWDRNQQPNSVTTWYYTCTLGYYWCGVYWLFKDARKKDWYNNCIHHAVTTFLLIASWGSDNFRIGVLYLWVSSSSDWMLQLSKVLLYLGYETASTINMTIFTLPWLYTRVYILPFKLVHSAIFEGLRAHAHSERNFYGIYRDAPWDAHLCAISLCILCVLNFIWTALLFVFLHKTLKKGGRIKDVRSDSECEGTAEGTNKNRGSPADTVTQQNGECANGELAGSGRVFEEKPRYANGTTEKIE